MLKKLAENIQDSIQYYKLKNKRNVHLYGTINIKGTPLIQLNDDAQLILGNNVTLNSRTYGYHTSMYSPVKIFADRSQAIISIGDNTRIHGTCIHAYKSITIGKNCLIAANTNIFDSNGHDLSFENPENRINTTGIAKPIKIEDNVWICINSVILLGVTIGHGSVIAAGSIVTKDIPPLCIAGGNPASVIKHYKDNNLTT